MLNSLTLQLRAATDLRNIKLKENKPIYADCLAIHEIFVPRTSADDEPSKRTMPIFCKFQKSTAKLATIAVRKGTPFVAAGKLDYYKDNETNREYFSFRVLESAPADRLQHAEEEESFSTETENVVTQ